MKLIYISNTRIPSEKANTSQSFFMCEAFSDNFEEVVFFFPNRKNSDMISKIEDPFNYYSVKKSFKLIKILCYDFVFIIKYSAKVWFIIQSISFGLYSLLKVLTYNREYIIFTRDSINIRLFSFAKKIGLLKNDVYFEMHEFNKKLIPYLNNINGVITQSKFNADLLIKNNIKNILQVNNGVKIETFKKIEKSKAKQLLNFEEDVEYITYVGRFNTMGNEKGIPEIIESLKYIDSSKVKLLCVGGPLDNVDKYYKIADNFGIDKDRLIFIDRRPVGELYKYISASSVLLMPFPYTEHYAYFMSPLKMFEYMASKRPIVASRLPSIEEVLKDKHNAILCEPDNPEDLANKIKWCLENDTSNLVNQAFSDVQNYTWDKRANDIVAFMRLK